MNMKSQPPVIPPLSPLSLSVTIILSSVSVESLTVLEISSFVSFFFKIPNIRDISFSSSHIWM